MDFYETSTDSINITVDRVYPRQYRCVLSSDVIVLITANDAEEAKSKFGKALMEVAFGSVGGSPSGYPGGDDHPCGGNYETQAERFGH